MASNLEYAEDIEEAKAYMAKKNVFQLFEVSNFIPLCQAFRNNFNFCSDLKQPKADLKMSNLKCPVSRTMVVDCL